MARYKLAELDLIQRIRPNDSASGAFEDGTRWTLETVPFIAPIEEGARKNPASVIRVNLTLEWMGRQGVRRQVIRTYRYQPGETTPIPSLTEQLNDLQ